jgi:hypothetical protein
MPQIPEMPEIRSASPQRAISGISGISDNERRAVSRSISAGGATPSTRSLVRCQSDSTVPALLIWRWAKMLRDIADEMESADSAARVA